MSLPKDFTTARPRAYSRMAPVISRLACASTGAFCALYREMSSRKPSDTAAASKAMSAVRGLNTNRLRNTTAPAVKGKPLCTRSPLRPGTDKKVDSVFSVQTKKREIVEEQHFLRISRFVSRLVF